MKKRTRQLDDDKEILLAKLPDGTPIWTTAESKAPLNPDEMAEFRAGISEKQRQKVVKQMVDAILQNTTLLMMDTVSKLNPGLYKRVNASVRKDDLAAAQADFDEWSSREGFRFKIDGLTTVIWYQGKVLLTMPARVDPRFEFDVRAALKRVFEEESRSE